MKIAVMGYSGSGKSTLARFLGAHYRLPVLHLDTVHFRAHWEERDSEEAREIVARFMENKDWVIDGNYSRFHRERRLEEADRIVFLDFNRFACLSRIYRRYRKYAERTRPDMADGCAEKLDARFVWWVLWEGRTRKRRDYFKNAAACFAEKTIVLKNQKHLDRYRKQLVESGTDFRDD